MYCWHCGTQVPDGAAFCPKCGKPLQQAKNGDTGGTAPPQNTAWGASPPQPPPPGWNGDGRPPKKKLPLLPLAAGALTLAVGVILFAVLRGGPDRGGSADNPRSTPSPSPSTTAPASPSPSEAGSEPSPSETGSEPSPTPSSGTYSFTDSRGEVLTATPGYGQVSVTVTKDGSVGRDAKVYLPTIFEYTDDDYTMGNESFIEYGGAYYSTSFRADGQKDFSFIEDYLSDLEDLGFTLERNPYAGTWYFNYSGDISHGAVEDVWSDSAYDLEVSVFHDKSLTSNCTLVSFDYSPDIAFRTAGGEAEYTSAKAAVRYSSGEKDNIVLTGWGEEDAELHISFATNAYEKGDAIGVEDLRFENDHFVYISDYLGHDYLRIDEMTAAEVEVLEKGDSCIALSFRFEISKGVVRYVLEGVCATRTGPGGDDASGAGSSLTPGGGTGLTCLTCMGKGLTNCHKCGGDGLVQCSSCHGVGYYYSSADQRNKNCSRCNGAGTLLCTASGCMGGKVKCGSCGGSGKQ